MAEIDHGARDHATWSASATERNWACAGALALTQHLPDRTSEAADWGTCCHQISERCLREEIDADSLIGTTEKGKKHSFEIDEEMAETAQTYVDYVRERAKASASSKLWLEQRFSLETLDPPFDAGGTGDAVIWNPDERLLEVIDLKGGRGVVVEVKGNPQLRTYGLGAVLANPGLAVQRIRVTIVQPRAGHKDGRIRSEDFDIVDLLDWTSDLVAAMRRSAKALADRGVMPDAAWAAAYLAAGDHCKFCRAAATCPALEAKAFDAAGVWFDDHDKPALANAPDGQAPEELAKTLDLLDMIEDWIKAVRAHAHDQAENGVTIPGYVLVEKRGREKWNEGVDEREISKAALASGIPIGSVYNPAKLRTPKQIRDAVAKQGDKPHAVQALADLKALSGTPSTGTNLVRETKTTRAAVKPAVAKHFDILG